MGKREEELAELEESFQKGDIGEATYLEYKARLTTDTYAEVPASDTVYRSADSTGLLITGIILTLIGSVMLVGGLTDADNLRLGLGALSMTWGSLALLAYAVAVGTRIGFARAYIDLGLIDANDR